MTWPTVQSDSPFPAGSGHAAGWQWAKDKGIESEDDLPERPGSFRDGAAAYVASLKPESSDH